MTKRMSKMVWVASALWLVVGCGAAPGMEASGPDATDDGDTSGSPTSVGSTAGSDTSGRPGTTGDGDSAPGSSTGDTGATTSGPQDADASTSETGGSTDVDTSDSGASTTEGGTSDSDESTTGGPLDCVDIDLGQALGAGLVNASVAGRGDEIFLPCSPIVGEDHVTAFTAPFRGVFTFAIDDDDDERTAVMVVDGDCSGQMLACAESYYGWSSSYVSWYPPRPLTVALDEGQTVLVVTTKPNDDAFVLGISGSEAVADDTCIDEDLGESVGDAVAVASEPTIYRFTAPHTGTYLLRPSSAVDVFVPGCAATIDTYLASIDVGLSGAPGYPDPGRAFDLVAGQQIAIAVSMPAEVTVELDIVPSASSGGTCCSPRTIGSGCNNQEIEMCVCEVDGFCCGTNWDGNCSGRAIHYCDATCIG